MVFDCIKFVPQFFYLEHDFSADYSKFSISFLFLNENLVTFLQINFTHNFVCTMNTHPEVSEGANLRRKCYISSFQKPSHFQTQRSQ